VSESISPGNTHYERQIDATDEQIDILVYELYGLTEKEIRISSKRPPPECAASGGPVSIPVPD